MFLAAAPYFQKRFESDEWILSNFQSAILSVSTVTSLGSMLILTNLQSKASYPKRISMALVLNIIVFAMLALSTVSFRSISPSVYLAFLLLMVFLASMAAALCQNGAFAFASGFGQPKYMQAIMTGQGIAGVLPCIAQIISVLAVPTRDSWAGDNDDDAIPQVPSTSAFVYFLTATAVSGLALLALAPLVRRHNKLMEGRMMESVTSIEEAERANRKVVGMLTLLKKLRWIAAAVFVCFAVTMFFPVFTSEIISIIPVEDAPKLLQPATFIPLAFLFWNIGDLSGRLLTILPFSLVHRPVLLFAIAVARLGFLPLYQLCNIRGRGAVVNSDAFYLIIVQVGFGLTNGWLGSSCMMGASEWVQDGEREAAGGFMGLSLVAGLTAGSLLSFAAGGGA
jgi:equilibrative nucleoside transporter 1/2/3